MLLHQILAWAIYRKIQKSCTKTINLKYQLQRRFINLNYYGGPYDVSDIQNYFEYIINKHETFIYVNKIEKRIRFKIKKSRIYNA